MRYSILSVLSQALQGNTGWKPVWRDAELKPAYDIVIVGGGGHGLATAFYLAKEHGLRHVAVLEKGWIGGGNVGRNTTIVRSNYLLPGNIPFYEWSMKLWEGLEQDFNYNAMVSQRGVLNLYHSDAQRDTYARRGNAMRLHGVDAELLDRGQEGGDGGGREYVARRGHGRPAAADREPRAPGVRVRGPQAPDPGRDHVRRRPFLRQPIRQGRSRLRWRYRRLQLLCATGQP